MKNKLRQIIAIILIFVMAITPISPVSAREKDSKYIKVNKSIYCVTQKPEGSQCGEVVLMKWGEGKTTATVKEYIVYQKKNYQVIGVSGTYQGKKKAGSVFGKSIKKVNLPKSVTFLGKNTLNGCKKIGQFTVPENVTRIEKGAFNNCPSLKKIVLQSRKTKCPSKGAFTKIHKKAVVYIPTGVSTKDNYKSKLQGQLTKGQKVKYNLKKPEIKVIEDGNVITGKSVQTDKISLKGVVFSNNKIKKVTYKVTDENGKIVSSGKCSETANWKLSSKLKDGTNEVKLTATDASGKKGTIFIYIVKASEEVQYQEQVKVESVQTGEEMAQSITDISEEGDNVYVTVENDSPIIDYIEDEKLKEGDVYLLQESSEMPAGFSGIYQGIEQKGGKTVVKFLPAGLDDIYEGEVTIDLSGKIDADNPIAYSDLLDGSELQLKAKARNAGFRKGLPDWLSIENQNGNYSLALRFADAVLYDGDGDEKTENDQLKLNGTYTISDLQNDFYFSKGMLSIKQCYEKLSYEGTSDIRLTAGAKLNTKSVVKKLNGKFDNKKNYGIVKLQGIDMSDSILLGVVGFNIATTTPVVSDFQTLQNTSEKIPVSPVVFVALLVHLDGSLEVQFTLGYEEMTYNEKGFNLQKPGYVGKYGAFDKSQGSSKKLLGYNFQTFNNTGKRRDDMSGTPKRKLYLSGEGKGKLEFGVGVMGAVMLDGLVPAGVSAYPYFEADGNAKGNVEIALPYEGVQANGEYQFNAQVGIAGKAAFSLTKKLKADKKFSVVLWKKHLEGKTADEEQSEQNTDDENTENEGDSENTDSSEGQGSGEKTITEIDPRKVPYTLSAGQVLTLSSEGNPTYAVWGLNWRALDAAVYEMVHLDENGGVLSQKMYFGKYSGNCDWRTNGQWLIKVYFGNVEIYNYSAANLKKKVTATLETGGETCDNPLILNKKSVKLKKGKTFVLSASFAFSEYSLKNVEFYSENPDIAEVDSNGVIKARKKGKTSITVMDREKFWNKCTVTVK